MIKKKEEADEESGHFLALRIPQSTTTTTTTRELEAVSMSITAGYLVVKPFRTLKSRT